MTSANRGVKGYSTLRYSVLFLVLLGLTCVANCIELSHVAVGIDIKSTVTGDQAKGQADPVDWFKGLSPRDQRIVTIFICVAMMIASLFLIIFGYRIFRPLLGLAALILLFCIMWIVLNTHSKLPWWAVLLISLACGIVGALISYFIYHVGVFLAAFAGGMVLGSLLLATPLGTKVVTQYWAQFGIMLGLALVCGIVALFFIKLVTIIATSLLGALLFGNGVDIAWLKTGILSYAIVNMLRGQVNPPITSKDAYILLGCCCGIALFGVLIQLLVTSRHFTYKLRSKKVIDEERIGLLSH